MAINWPSKEQIRASILTLWSGERPDADTTKYSDLWLFSRVASVLVYRLHRTIAQALNAVFPTSSFGTYLDNWLVWVGLPDGQGGYGRILPHISAAESGFTIESAAGMAAGAAAIGDQLTDTAGNLYQITEANAIIGVGGTEDVDIESITTGFGVNLAAGAVLTWVAIPVGADSTGTLAKPLTGGTPLEEDSAARVRLLGRLRNPPASGNVADWTSTIEAVSPGNLTAYVWPQRQNYTAGQETGAGTTDYCALYTNETGTDRHIAAADDMYTDISDAVAARMPALMYLNSRQLTLVSVLCPVELTVTLGSGATSDQKCDWDAENIKPKVLTNDASGPLITCDIDVCEGGVGVTVGAGLAVGHKVVIDGVEGEVTAVVVGGDHAAFNVGSWPSGWPSGGAADLLLGFNVTAGGGFIGWKTDYDNGVVGSGIVNAVQEYLDGRGPNMSYSGATTQITGWNSDVLTVLIASLAIEVGGGVIVDLVGALPAAPFLSHADESGATALIYDITEITVWQVYT